MDTKLPSRTFPTELPPPPPSGVVMTGLKNAEFSPHKAALDALEIVRQDLVNKMNVCKSPTEAKTLGETFRSVVSTMLALEGFEAP